jgi:diguanylate cyclase (GGDEF)-like protein/PAS domain S-box-containing protein
MSNLTHCKEALAACEARFSATFEQLAVGIAFVDSDGNWLNVNRRCYEIFGYPKEGLLNLRLRDITHPDDRDADQALFTQLLDGERNTYSIAKRYFTKANRLIWVNLTVCLVRKSDSTPDYFVNVIEDITRQRQLEDQRDDLIADIEKRVRERTAILETLSMTDSLTGIANRRCFQDTLELEWDRAVRTRQPLSIVLIDIDFFKLINDEFGHATADGALISIATTLGQIAKRSNDLAARYGGDEFVVVLPETDVAGATRVANRVREKANSLESIRRGPSVSIKVTLSQGVATAYPAIKGTSAGLMLAADRALYRSKQEGRNSITVSGPENLSN